MDVFIWQVQISPYYLLTQLSSWPLLYFLLLHQHFQPFLHRFFCHHLWCFRTFPCTRWELPKDYGRFELVDIKTMVSRHCGIELLSLLAANKKHSKLTSTLLCWRQVTLKYVFISLKKKMVVIPDFYVLELFAVLFLNVFLSWLINNNILSSEEWSWQLWTQFMQLRKRSLKKIQDFDGIWTRDLAIQNTWPAPNISSFIA